jgi:hypothetical protein
MKYADQDAASEQCEEYKQSVKDEWSCSILKQRVAQKIGYSQNARVTTVPALMYSS